MMGSSASPGRGEILGGGRQMEMIVADAVHIYTVLEDAGVAVWIDGGWGVDALLGRQLRPHKDLDIAVAWRDVGTLRRVLGHAAYTEVRAESQWNFVLS